MWVVTKVMGAWGSILYTAGLVLLTDILRFLQQVTLTSFWCCWSWELRESTLSLVVSSSSLVADTTLFFSRAACWACCNWSTERTWMKYQKLQSITTLRCVYTFELKVRSISSLYCCSWDSPSWRSCCIPSASLLSKSLRPPASTSTRRLSYRFRISKISYKT